jgi:hypothetical protein
MSQELRDLISGAMTELDPETDNQNQIEEEVQEDFDSEEVTDVDDDSEVEDESEETEDEEDTEEQEDAGDVETHSVKVNGEVLEVSLKELKAGYQRQSDYTREKQALKREVEDFQQVRETLVDAYEGVKSLEEAWEENPVNVLAEFTSNTENPTLAVAMLIKELASENLLDRDFLDMFGVTADVQRQWAMETRSTRQQVSQNKEASSREQQLSEAQYELEVQKAMSEYESQIDDILESEGLNFNTKQRTAFRQELAKYAAENELTNLKAAYKAFKYEETQKKKAAAVKTAEKVKQKKAASVVARSGSGAEGSSPVEDNSDLNSIIRAAMKDTQGKLG